jgi:hypothetical protein
VLKKIRLNLFDAFSPDELKDYQMHPQRGLKYALSRKLQLSNVTKDAILYHHTIPNNKGFPIIAAEKLGVEPQMLRFCQKLDEQMIVCLGRPKPQFKEVFLAMMKEASDFSEYTPKFVMGMRSVTSSI